MKNNIINKTREVIQKWKIKELVKYNYIIISKYSVEWVCLDFWAECGLIAAEVFANPRNMGELKYYS